MGNKIESYNNCTNRPKRMKIHPMDHVQGSQITLQPRPKPSPRHPPKAPPTSLSNYISTHAPQSCPICHEERPEEQMVCFGNCGHVFCLPCVDAYVKARMDHNQRILCCGDGCEKGLRWSSKKRSKKRSKTQLYVHRISADSKLILKQYVKKFKQLQKRCPKCQYNETGLRTTKCQACQQQESVMIPDGLKKCPSCSKIIEKQKGCDHVKCVCGHHFCFMCSVQWDRNHICEFKIPQRTGLAYILCGILKMPLYMLLGTSLFLLFLMLALMICLLSACFYGMFLYFKIIDKISKVDTISSMSKFIFFLLATLALPLIMAICTVPGFLIPIVNLCYNEVIFLGGGILRDFGLSMVGCINVLQLL